MLSAGALPSSRPRLAAASRSVPSSPRFPARPPHRARLVVTNAAPQQMLVFVPPHPLVKHWIAVLRSAETPTPVFRSAAQELGKILLYELTREWLPTMDGQVMTPTGHLAVATFVVPTKPLVFVPVLRGGGCGPASGRVLVARRRQWGPAHRWREFVRCGVGWGAGGDRGWQLPNITKLTRKTLIQL